MKTNIKNIIEQLKLLTKYEPYIDGGCQCCGSWIEHESDENGNWVKVEDINKLINELQETI